MVTMPGTGSGLNSPPNNANATIGAAAAVGEQILQVPVLQPGQHPFYMDQNFLQTMSNMFNQALDARLGQNLPPVSPIQSEHNQSRPRTSTPNSQDGRTHNDRRQQDSPTNITQNFAGVHASDPPPTFNYFFCLKTSAYTRVHIFKFPKYCSCYNSLSVFNDKSQISGELKNSKKNVKNV